MIELSKILKRSQSSAFYKSLLNTGLRWLIPFNGPHKFKIENISDNFLTITVPYIRKNKNHVNGIHACALATVCEYITGLSLTRELSSNEYRIILKEIQMSYHYQAKMNVLTTFALPENEITVIKVELEKNDAVFRRYTVEVYDYGKHHICTGNIFWQIKPWSKAKTKSKL